MVCITQVSHPEANVGGKLAECMCLPCVVRSLRWGPMGKKKCLRAMTHSANKQRNNTNLLWLLVLCLLSWPLWFFIILLFSWHRTVFTAGSNITTFFLFVPGLFFYFVNQGKWKPLLLVRLFFFLEWVLLWCTFDLFWIFMLIFDSTHMDFLWF